MSFIDSRWEVWDNDALTVTEESRSNGNMFDLEEDGVTDESVSPFLWFNLQIGTAFGGLAEGCYFSIITSDSATFASANWCIGAIGSAAYPILVAQMTAKARWSIACPAWGLKKYLEVVFTAVNSAANAGTVDAWFGLEPLCPTGRLQKAITGYTM
jgi:hypothetical protein